MDRDGHDLKQHTHHRGLDVQSASLSDGRIAYQCGADLWLLDLESGADADHSHHPCLRLRSVARPLGKEAARLPHRRSHRARRQRRRVSPRAARSSRCRKDGRIVKVAGDSGIRYREARYMPDGKSIFALSTETGETEFWKYPANGVGKPEQWTHDAKFCAGTASSSPDGRWLAHRDKDQQLWLYDIKTKAAEANRAIDDRRVSTTSPGRPIASGSRYVEGATNTFSQIKVLNANTGDDSAAHLRPLQQHAAHLEQRRQMALLPLRPHAKDHDASPWGPRSRNPTSTAP